MHNKKPLSKKKKPVSKKPTQATNPPAVEPDRLSPPVDKNIREAAGTPSAPATFLDFPGLVRYLPMYRERKLRELVKLKIVPTLRLPGTRKLAFHLPSVEAALVRFQKGGIE